MARQAGSQSRCKGSALVEFAIVLPLLVVFIVGIYDFSAAYNQKQKIEHAALAGVSIAAGQPTGDMASANPDSLQPVLDTVFNSLAGDNVLPLANLGSCKTTAAAVNNNQLQWTYTISGCDPNAADNLSVVINRGVVVAGAPATVSTSVTVIFPYHWRFNSVIQLVAPGASYAAITDLRETATVHSQM
jgi:Flp pilus assembly protein TadG